MAIPTLTPLPDPPLPTDPEAVFDAKAGNSLTAQKAMIDEMNAGVIPGINQAVIDASSAAGAAEDARDAAASSAGDAAQQVQLAAAQVGLANTARQGAEAARDDAQAAAIAAGAAAGLPPERVPFSVLQINGAGAVSWGYGTPDASAAVVGQALILGPGKVPTWGYAGAQIGDILYTSRNPGAGYLPCNGGIYAQASYPVLFSQLGLIGGQRATSFVVKNATVIFEYMVFGDNGVVLAVSNTAGSVGNVYRSTDYGATFALAASAITSAVILTLTHLGGTKWMVTLNLPSNHILVSDDNGSTFTTINVNTSGNAMFYVATDKSGTVLATASNVVWRSVDYGRTFVNTGASSIRWLCYAGGGRWIGSYDGQSSLIRVSDDAFTTFQNRNLGGSLAGAIVGIDADPASGTILVAGDGSQASNLATSYDRGETWNTKGTNAAHVARSLVCAGGDTWIIINRLNSTNYSLLKSTDGAKTFTAGPTVATSVAPLVLTADQVKGYVIANARAAGAAGYATSTPSFGYDTNTQFKLPTLLKQEGSTPYVRAL